ncbi:MAG TPA: endonuclease/exonuclease/phosphatase family protein [Caulobacteraceae bacterium]|nr:endonuclease/exonuclease/phosphatase family protein [Caulobacteraceae bacterium]
MTKRLTRLAIWAAWVGVIALGLAVAGATYEVTDDKAIDFLAQFGAPTLALCAGALEIALIWRRWIAAAGLVVTVSALVFALQGQWFPPHASSASPTTRIYFANIWDENRDIARAARSVANANPDVAAMVEFSDRHRAAQARLFPELPYRVLSPGNPAYAGKPGAVIASRWPLRPLTAAATWNFNILAARVEEPGAPFRLIVVHLTRPWPFRRRQSQADQIKRLVAAIETPSDVPTVVVGDFNATASGYLLKALMAQENLSAAPAIMGDWPANLPGPFRIAIENAFAGTGATIVSRRLGRPTGSDHRPIVLEIAPTKAP